MSCPLHGGEGAELLLAYCARRLDADTRTWLEGHMSSCADCRVLAEQQQAVWEALDQWDALPVSEEFDARLRERIQACGKEWAKADARIWRSFPLPLAAASILLCAVMLLRWPGGLRPDAQPIPAAEVEAVEAALEDIEMLRTLDLMAWAGPSHAEGM